MERSIQVQAQIRRDAEEHGRALRELQGWGEEMKRRQEEEERAEQEGDACTQVLAAAAAMAQPGRAIEDGRNDNGGGDHIGGGVNSGYYVDDADRSPMDMASAERQRGNDCYAAGRYDDAIKSYTACLRFDPQSAVAYSNRAMAHLKKRDWRKAEDDASSALAIDPSHVKSYHRRSVARASLGMLRAALLDLSRAEAELELLEDEDGSGGGGNKTPRDLQKSIASERRRVESLLRAAMKRAPKRCNVPIVVVRDEEEEGKEEAAKEEEDDDEASVANDAISMAKENGVDNYDSARDTSRESNDWVVVDTGDSGKEATRTTNNSPAKPLSTRRQHEKPKTWYDFEITWRSLDSLEERSAYLSSIKPKWLAVLYRNGMEDVEIVVGIVVAAAAMLVVEEESNNKAAAAAEYIDCVANTKAIDISAMMMDDGQRKQVREAIGKVFDGGDDGGDDVAAKLGCFL